MNRSWSRCASNVGGRGGNAFCYRTFHMFAGLFDQHVIYASHPFIVIEGEDVSGSFSTFEAAEDFIAKKASYTAFILRHDGQKWVIAKDRLINPLFGPDRWEFVHGKPSGRR